MISAVSFRDDAIGGAINQGESSEKKSRFGKAKQKQQKNKKSFLEVHFSTIIILLRLKTNSYEKSLFLFIILIFLISVTNMNNFLQIVKDQYPTISQDSSTFSLMNSLKYLDVAQLLSFAGTSSLFITIGISMYMITMTLLYCVCFIDKYQNPKSKPRKYFYGRWFVNMANYFVQALSFPFNVIFLSFIFCTEENLEGDAEKCSFFGEHNSYYSIIFSFSLIGFILSLFNEWWLQIFFYNTKLYKKDATSIEKEPSFLLELNMLRLIIALFTTVKFTDSYGYFVCFLAVQLFSILFVYIRLSFTLASFTFANNNLFTAYQYGIIFLLAQQISFILDEIHRVSSFYTDKSEKYIFFLVFFCIILLAFNTKARELQMRYILFKPIDFTKISASQLFFKIATFQKLNSLTSTSVFQDSIYKGIANEHLELPCLHPNLVEMCFCKQKILYDPKKRKDTALDKIFLSQNNSVFTKFIVKSWYETFLHLNQADYINYLYYSEFLYFKMKNVSLALKNLAILENKYLSPVQKFRLYRLYHIIIKHNRKRNHDSYRLNQSDKDNRNKLEIETVIPSEEQISQIQSGIKFIIKNNIRFWAYLEKSNVNLNEINKLAKFSLKQLDLLKKLWKECMYYLDYRKKWRFYFCWQQNHIFTNNFYNQKQIKQILMLYCYNIFKKTLVSFVYCNNQLKSHFIVLSKKNYITTKIIQQIKVSMLERFAGISNVNENDVFSEELQQEVMDDDVVSVHSNLKVDEMEKIYIKKVEMAFDKKSIIFHVNHEYKAIYHGFGYTALELTGQIYISQLMPRIYQNIHHVLMKNFAQTGKTKTLYSQRKIFCLNKAGHLFPAWKFVKQYVTTTGKCEYVAMIRPIIPPSGTKIYYIICNEDWDIDSMSETIYEGFGVDALQYQNNNLKNLLNILILAPKLIRYTKFAKYLTEQDLKLFQNQRGEQDRQRNNNQSGQMKNFTSRFSILARLKKEQQNAFIKQDSGGTSPKDSTINVDTDPNTPTSNFNIPNLANTTKPLSSFNQMYNQQTSLHNTLNQTNNLQKPNISIQPTTPNSNRNQTQTTPVAMNTSQTLAQNTLIQKPKLQKKRTLVINSQDEQQNYKPINTLKVEDSDDTPKQLQKSVTKEQIGVSAASLRRNSNKEILEQLNYGQNQQFLQQNFIRDEIMKKKQQMFQQQNQSSSFNEEIDAIHEQDEKSDYEAESQENLNQFEDDTNEFLKLDNLEKGEQVSMRLKIPTNLNDLLTEYNSRISQSIQRKNSRAEQNTTYNIKTTKFFQPSATTKTKNGGTNYASESHDKSVYYIIRDMILKYQLKKSQKEYNVTCSASYKKTGKQRIIVIKLTRFDEGLKKNRLKNAVQQLSGSGGDEFGKKFISFASGLGNEYSRQISQSEQNQKVNQYISMRSEFSDVKENVISNNGLALNRLQANKPSDQIHSDTEDLIGSNPQAKEEESDHLGKTNGMGYQLKVISEQDENGVMSERSHKTFHKDFINRQGARNISLSQNDNIYLKEDNHKPNKNIKTIQNMKVFVRLFFLSLIALQSFTFFYGPNDQFPVLRKQSNKIFQAKNVLLSALQAYNLILDQILFNNGYYKDSLPNQFWTKDSYQNLIQTQLKNETKYFYEANKDISYKQTFFDKSITPYNQYTKYLFNGTNVPENYKNQTFNLDIYDLFSQLIFSLQTIQETASTEIKKEITPVQFIRQNIFPYIYDGLRKAQDNLVEDLKDTTSNVYKFLIIIIIVESVLLFASFIILFHLIFVICNAFKSIIEVFPKISHRDLKKIKNYNINLNMNFSYIVEKDDYLSGTHQIYQTYSGKQAGGNGTSKAGSEQIITENGGIVRKHTHNYDLEEPNDGNENVGKKSKDVNEGGFLKKLRMNIFGFFAVFILFVAIFTAIFLFMILQSTSNLQLILDNGDVFMNTFGDNIVMMIAIKEKTVEKDNYNNIFKKTIESLIEDYIKKNMQPRVESLDFLTFDNVFDEIFYGNPCVILESQLKEETAQSEECLSVSQGSLKKGVASFNSFYKNAISNYVSNGVDSQTLDNTIIFDYDRGIYYVDLFQVYLVKVWSENTDSYLQDQLTQIIIYVSVMIVGLLIVYLIVTEKMLIGRFNSEYSYFRTIYNMYMPEIIIQKEKRIKFWLVKHYILNK